MKKQIILLFAGLFAVMSGCQKPDELEPTELGQGLNSISIMFGEGEFKTDAVATFSAPATQEEILIKVPWFYPIESDKVVSTESLKKMRVMADLDPSCKISPKLGIMDMTKKNPIVVTNKDGSKKSYNIRAEVTKLDLCDLLGFEIESLGLTGVIDAESKSVSIITIEDITALKAKVILSPHATISPDPTVARDYTNGVKFTVTAHDGVAKKEYTVTRNIPEKIPFGIRPGSAKILWEKKLNADIGITTVNMTGGMAVTGKYLMLNTRAENSVLVDRTTGARVKTYDLPAEVKGSTVNFYNTADDDGNVLICNLSPNVKPFKVWKVAKGLESQPVEIIAWNTTEAIGRKLSIQGSLDGNAIITAPLVGSVYASKVARWVVVGGVVQNQTPEIVTAKGLNGAAPGGWTTNADVVSSSSTVADADYFVSHYAGGAGNFVAWINGSTNAVRKQLDDCVTGNYTSNSIDYATFNGGKYIAFSSINNQTWGGGGSPATTDCGWVLDVTTDANFTGKPTTSPSLIFNSKEYRTYAIGPQNANATSDIALVASPDGYMLYMYMMWTNGWIVAVQFDCIKK